MLQMFLYYFLLFFIYSILGWIVESIVCSVQANKMILNRGFLIGPYLPIYGTAAVAMVLFLNEYKSDPFVLFCMAVVYASLLEYFTSVLLEKIFHARWWNYTDEKFNIDGRICLKNCLLFGVLGFFVLYVIHPGIVFILNMIPNFLLKVISIFFLIIFLCDVFITVYILSKLNIRVKNIESDATEEIDKEVKKLLRHYRVLYRRLFKSFPKIEFTVKHGDLLIDRIRNRFDEVDDFLADKKKEIKNIKKEIKKMKDEKVDGNALDEEKKKLKEVRKKKI